MKPIKRLWPIPKNLEGYGAEYYKRVGKHLVSVEALTELDRESFLSLCGAYHLMQMSLDSVNADGLNVQGSQDDIKKNPALTTYKNASDIFHRLSKREVFCINGPIINLVDMTRIFNLNGIILTRKPDRR